MLFTVLPRGARVPQDPPLAGFLETDDWDDWFKFNTMYYLYIIDNAGNRRSIGSVKIGQFGMRQGQRRPDVPNQFTELPVNCFSLGQDDSYYARLNDLGESLRDSVLRSLRDVASDADLFERALGEQVTGVSLLRSVTPATVRGQFRRIAAGGARLSRYEFSYTVADTGRPQTDRTVLSFTVEPESQPPSNIHVLIGRNGVGKTHLLNHMTRALVPDNATTGDIGCFTAGPANGDDQLFANVVSVTFSAFDPFEPLPARQNKATSVQYAYIGLKRMGTSSDGKPNPPKSPGQLSAEFSKSVRICRHGARAARWRRALQMLEADPIFADAEVAELAPDEGDGDDSASQAAKLFSRLSSGHKIVLLTITKLVETVEERTIVLLDEPEAHLHPPLLSAFVRALSDLLVNRNGVAVIATHSPVILQEVPRTCVWKIARHGRTFSAERPDIETFGENVGVLTREVFGLEDPSPMLAPE